MWWLPREWYDAKVVAINIEILIKRPTGYGKASLYDVLPYGALRGNTWNFHQMAPARTSQKNIDFGQTPHQIWRDIVARCLTCETLSTDSSKYYVGRFTKFSRVKCLTQDKNPQKFKLWRGARLAPNILGNRNELHSRSPPTPPTRPVSTRW